jgi:hypothetical protein
VLLSMERLQLGLRRVRVLHTERRHVGVLPRRSALFAAFCESCRVFLAAFWLVRSAFQSARCCALKAFFAWASAFMHCACGDGAFFVCAAGLAGLTGFA